MGPDLDLFDEFLPGSSAKNAGGGRKFQPKAKPRKAPLVKSSVNSFDKVKKVVTDDSVNKSLDHSVAGEIVEVNASLNNSENLTNVDTYFGLESLEDFCLQPTTAADIDVNDSKQPSMTTLSGEQKLSEVDEAQDLSGAGFEFSDITMGVKEDNSVPFLEISDDMFGLSTSPELRTGKFEPEPNVPHSSGKSDAKDSFSDRVESASHMQEPPSAVSPDEFILDEFSYAFPESNAEFEPYPSLDSTFELPGNNDILNEETAPPVEISQEDISFSAMDASASKVATEGDERIETEEADNNDQDRVSDKHKKKPPAKSKKSVSQKGKSASKRKRDDENPDQPTKKSPKRFPRATRRPKRQVNKALLETPEDELDLQQISIRDIILLAEHREKIEKDGKKAAKSQSTNPSASNSNPQDMRNENASEQAGFNDEETDPPVQDGTFYTNYHSYMERTPRLRWSKQDTELFYQGVRQFGSDLSFIQQLFPGRSRTQIKLKYKKEERQNPMMLDDALTGRAKDNSHFEQLIKLLKTSQDDSADFTNNEDLCGPDISGVETEKSEKVVEKTEPEEEVVEKVEPEKEEEVEKAMEQDETEIRSSPAKYDNEDEDDDMDYGNYSTYDL
ncbi:transcription factor TFIIIB component B'' homolog isoform X2 [Impatiens glandulifera]|uniref:transcription factor TFIIIB component B'' homolog isoform X2 n=1 Tax=Impatiens glandulifera TaxID=253017 RepID=UPI001FB105EC|nr:transcription factor TFIIIB component B'' homolog isoform X2 [Impatiens glandulifera]